VTSFIAIIPVIALIIIVATIGIVIIVVVHTCFIHLSRSLDGQHSQYSTSHSKIDLVKAFDDFRPVATQLPQLL
jgi:hypothetical protein